MHWSAKKKGGSTPSPPDRPWIRQWEGWGIIISSINCKFYTYNTNYAFKFGVGGRSPITSTCSMWSFSRGNLFVNLCIIDVNCFVYFVVPSFYVFLNICSLVCIYGLLNSYFTLLYIFSSSSVVYISYPYRKSFWCCVDCCIYRSYKTI